MPVRGQPTAFVIGETDTAAQVRAEDAVFFNQVGDARLPLISPPAGHCHHEQSNRGDIHHRGSLHQRLRSRVLLRPRSGTLRGCTKTVLELADVSAEPSTS